MKKYVFLTGQYLPKPGATGLCIHKLAKELALHNYVITVCFGNKSENLEIDGVKVIKFKAPTFLRGNEKSKWHIFLSRFSKLIHFKDYPLRSKRMRNNYVRKTLNIIEENDDITIIASFSPLEAVAALPIIKKKIKCKRYNIIYYSSDTLSNEQGSSAILSGKLRGNKGIEWEKKIFSICDLIFIMECHREHYFSKEFEKFKPKMRLVNFPLIDKELYSAKKRINKKIEMVYAGTLYKSLRNPSALCDILLSIQDIDFHATFLGGGDCDEIMKEKCVKSKGKIEYLGMQSHDVAVKIIQDSDILLSIGNMESPMMPSKIYEYISTGKPIIHFYTWDKDPCLPILRKYGNSVLINENNIETVRKFLEYYLIVSYEDICKVFMKSTPAYTVNFIRNV